MGVNTTTQRIVLPVWVCLLLIALSINSVAAQVEIIAYEIPGLHQADKQGAYDKVLQKLVVEDKLATLDILPPARAERTFESCQNCCITPVNNNPEFYEFANDVIATAPINHARIYIFSPPGSSPINSLSELKDKVIGTRFGMPYGNTFDAHNLKKIEIYDLHEHVILMKRGHIDAFIAYAPDIYDTFRDLGIPPYPHNRKQPYAFHPDSLVCRAVSTFFVDNYNQRLRALRKSRELQQILGHRYLPAKID